MRVLIVSHLALPHVGGVEVLVDQEIRALLGVGHQVTLLTSDGMGQAQNPQYPGDVRIVRVPAWHGLERRFRLPYPIFAPSLASQLWHELERCETVHIHGYMFLSSVVAALLGRARGKTIILTDHGGIQHFQSRVKRLLVRIGAATAGRITARCSHRLVAYNTRIARLLERLAARPGQCELLPNPVNRNLFRPPSEAERSRLRAALGWQPDRRKVLFVGRLTEEKGVPGLLHCANPSYDLVFCGPGNPNLLGDLPRPGIEYLPPRPQTELVKLYQSADVLVVPSQPRESFPVVVQEALHCGLPVVLGDDEGFEPYRRIGGLSFCQPRVIDIQAGIEAALAAPEVNLNDVQRTFPTAESWISSLLGTMNNN
jgi:glycosyltransferase involved in cell wall biosynthesis